MLEPPVFILGSPRSGTTLLSHLLLSAGGFAVVRSELHALNIIGPRFGGLKSESDRAALVETWLATEVHRRTGLSAERLRELVMGEVRSATDFLGTVMEEVCAIQGARRWSDCTPENVAYIEPLALAFPEARFLHVVRDGRDVAASIAKRGLANAAARDEGRELEVAALLWEWFVKQGRRGCEAFSERSMEVRYEELVSDRGGSLERISAFIGHEVDPARVEEFALGSVSKPNTSFEEDLEKGSFQPVERWRSSLSKEELARLEGLVGETLTELGYERSIESGEEIEDGALRARYHRTYAIRQWLKARTPLGRRTDASALDDFEGGVADDLSLRPAEHPDFIRRVVGEL